MPALGALLLAALDITAETVGTFAFTVISAVVNTTIAVGLSLAASFLLGSAIPNTADNKIPKRQSTPPRVRGFGRSPSIMFYMLYEVTNAATAPVAGSVRSSGKPGNSIDIFAVHDCEFGPIDAFEAYYLNDDEVTLDGTGLVAAIEPKYHGGIVQIKTRLGLATEAAYTEATTGLPTIWTSNHRGDGIASLLMICSSVDGKHFSDYFPNGLPQPWEIGRWRKCYQIRKDGSVPGGSGSHRAADMSTWEWTENPVDQLCTYQITDAGQDFTTRILPEAAYWITASAVCDEDVALAEGGTQKRYTAGGMYQVDNAPADIQNTLLACFDGWIGETGSGALRVYAGRYYAPTVTLGVQHITAFQVQRYVPDESAVNEIDFTFSDATQKYAQIEGAPWRDEGDILLRGKVLAQRIDMPWVHTHAQGRRLAKRLMHRAQSPARGSVRTDLYGFVLLGERYITMSIPELPSLGSFTAEISKATINIQERSLSFDWVLVTPAIDDWNEAAEQGLTPSSGDPLTLPDLPIPQNVTAVSQQVEISPDVMGARLVVTFDTPDRTDLAFSVLYRTHDSGSGAGEWFEYLSADPDMTGPTVMITTIPVQVDTLYDVKVASIGTLGSYSDYSDEVLALLFSTLNFTLSDNSMYLPLMFEDI